MPETKSPVLNTIHVITREGVISDSIEIEVNGEPKGLMNTSKNWKILYALSTYSVNKFFAKHIKWDGTETITPWEESPTFLHRKKLFATV